MNRKDFDAWEIRVQDRADVLWAAAGSPEGGSALYLDAARELIAMGEVAIPTLDPIEAAEPVVEEASLQANLGEFPTLTDQGDEQLFPMAQDDARDDFDEIGLSDGDASDNGGVLPDADVPEEDMPDVSLAHADITTSSVNAGDGPQTDDLNDDGMPDPSDLDEDDEDDEEDEDDDDEDEDDENEDDEDDTPADDPQGDGALPMSSARRT
jgi:hypothetical protein